MLRRACSSRLFNMTARRHMSVCVVAQHDNKSLDSSVSNTITAATQIDSDLTVLVAGNNCQSVADQVLFLNAFDCIVFKFNVLNLFNLSCRVLFIIFLIVNFLINFFFSNHKHPLLLSLFILFRLPLLKVFHVSY